MAQLFVCGLAMTWLAGCNKPCAATADCNGGDVCVATVCRSISCEETIFARDPATGACTPLSGCFLTDAQRGWQTCQEDPCAGLAESACLSDTRCQPTYSLPDDESVVSTFGGSFSVCGGSQSVLPGQAEPGPDNTIVAPGVNQGNQPKHGGSWNNGCTKAQSRQFAGCRAAPTIAPQTACTSLSTDQCASRSDCHVTGGQCEPIYNRKPDCAGADSMSCLTNASCQPTGTRCYCPPGATCDCSGGQFFGCETNDRLRRCSSSADCNAGERCDNDEDCIAPRTFSTAPTGPTLPGDPACLGACVPVGCAGFGEQRCSADPSCDAGHYVTVCRRQYYSEGNGPSCSLVDDAAANSGFGACGCGGQFTGCATLAPVGALRTDRSLLVRDPEIVDDPAFSLTSVLTQLAPAGLADAFVDSLLTQLGTDQKLSNGVTAKGRAGVAQFYATTLKGPAPGLAQRLGGLMATTALINRLDLATTGNCGEARLSFALNNAYTDGNQRLTLIVELKVPDDGKGCQLVAQQWAELSLVDDVGMRRSKLLALYGALLKPQNLGQLRTNEFLNLHADEPWELREFHLRPADGLLALVPAAQTVDSSQVGTPGLNAWLRANAAGLQAGTAIIPAQFLAGASTEDGGRVHLTAPDNDPTAQQINKSVNALTCAGCHLTETDSPFVHIGERLASQVSGAYRPSGRAVVDDFLQQELPKRAALLQSVLAGSNGLVALDWRPQQQARVH
jgi:hypothetical protein